MIKVRYEIAPQQTVKRFLKSSRGAGWLIYRFNGSNAKPMAPTSIESSEKERRLNEEVPLQKVTYPRLHLDRRTRTAARVAGGRSRAARGPSWGHLKVVLGAIRSFLEPFCGHLSPKIDKVS